MRSYSPFSSPITWAFVSVTVRNRTFLMAGAPPQYLSLARITASRLGMRLSKTYGPVPTGSHA